MLFSWKISLLCGWFAIKLQSSMRKATPFLLSRDHRDTYFYAPIQSNLESNLIHFVPLLMLSMPYIYKKGGHNPLSAIIQYYTLLVAAVGVRVN